MSEDKNTMYSSSSTERARQYAAAQRLKEDVQHLKERWKSYNFPVQELLRLMLNQHGLQAAILATDALDRQFSRTTSTDTTIFRLSVGVTTHTSPNKKWMVFHERCVKASLF